MSYTELTVWTRGIIMDKEGRDIVNSIAASARNEGKFSQAMENYVDNPDRTNAPTRKYLRVSDSEIENALTYENEHPNIVVLVEGKGGGPAGLAAAEPGFLRSADRARIVPVPGDHRVPAGPRRPR